MSEKKISALAEYFKSKGVTQSAIAEELGVSKAYVNSLMNGKKAFGKAQAAKWGDLYGLSPSWLLTGEGEMLKDGAPATQPTQENSARPLVSSDRDWVDIPLVPHRAQAGALSGFGDPCWEEDKQTMPVLIDKRLKGDYLLFEVSGDSMDDGSSTAFLDGDILLCRVLPKSDWQFGIKKRGETYCVVATDAEGIVLKEVVNHDKANNEIICHSLNSQYKDYSVKLDDVQGIFYVEELVKRKF
jgi:transcriptional regulator with XRE-family HTH domain